MGMFDHVKFRMDCPTCGKVVDGFQTKRGRRLLDVLEFWETTNFYSFCEHCGTWIEFERIMKPCTIDEFKMIVQTKEERELENKSHVAMKHEVHITRKCAVCGKRIQITVHGNSTYEGGHFFGRVEVPSDPSQYEIVGEDHNIIPGKVVPIFEWTGDCKAFEYWECDECYNEPDKNDEEEE